MNYLKLTFIVTIIFVFNTAFAQDKPDIDVKRNADSYEVTLKNQNQKELSKILIHGFTFAEGNSKNFNIEYTEAKLKKSKGNSIEIHQLDKNTDYVLYTVTTFSKDGEKKQLPTVKVNMPVGYSQGNKL